MIGVVSFPGSNGDHDALVALRDRVGVPTRLVDHRETDLSDLGGLVLPGGFSYGDHLRCGAIARFAPVMDAVGAFARHGGPVLGICNGFQILTEAHLLPGALLRNRTLRFHCHWTYVRIENTDNAWTSGCSRDEVLRLPVAHGAGAYYAPRAALDELEGAGQVVGRYCDAAGDISPETNLNGSARNIAGVRNYDGNVVGLMPHPERAADALVGGEDGLRLLRSALAMLSVAV